MVNNHGDRKSPKWGYGTPYKWPFQSLINGGDPNYLRPSWDDPSSLGPINVNFLKIVTGPTLGGFVDEKI